jgi:N-acetylglucosamine kinase-like BadF-type ATPase
MAGVSHPSATGVVRAALAQLVEPPVRVLRDDGAIALRAAHGAAPGVLVMAGTGSGAQAQGPEGWHRTGGWGPVLGDEGSAHAIGLAALRAIVRAEDGRIPRTVLTERVMATVEHPEVRMLPFLLKQERIDLPQLFILVDEAAREGDLVARGILKSAAGDLAALADAAARLARVPPGATVATTGSVIGFSVFLRDALMEAIELGTLGLERGPHVERPVEGAVAWALDALREDAVPIVDW